MSTSASDLLSLWGIMIQYKVFDCFHRSVLKVYSNKPSAYRFARKYKASCYVVKHNSLNNESELIRAYL